MFYMLAALSAMDPEKQRRFASEALDALRFHGNEIVVREVGSPVAFDIVAMREPYYDGHDLPELPDDWEEQAARAVSELAKSLVGQAPAKKVEPKARPPP